MTELEKEFYPLGAITGMGWSAPVTIGKTLRVERINDRQIGASLPEDQGHPREWARSNESVTWQWIYKPDSVR